MSISPASSPFSILFLSLVITFLERTAILTPVSLNLFLKLSKCWELSNVVGTNIQVCLSFKAAIREARIATSVFPKPTSPQINLSMGL